MLNQSFRSAIENSRGKPATILGRKLKIQHAIRSYRESIERVFSFLQEESLPDDAIALGSAYGKAYRKNPDFVRFCDLELDIRVGHGHDILQKLRLLSGLRVFYI
jgi:hypothetical protein